MDQTNNTSGKKFTRRDMLKGLATIPVAGVFAFSIFEKLRYEKKLNQTILSELNLSTGSPEPAPSTANGKQIRIGLVGYGIRGTQLMRGLGFAHPEWIDEMKKGAKENRQDKRYADYIEQEDMNVVVTGVCDVYDIRAEKARIAAANIKRQGTDGELGAPPKRYRNYRDLIHADDVDAIIIATPDHWHTLIAIEAAKAGKHVYVEKGMTRTVEEAYMLRDAIKRSGIVFQLGHQGRQTESYMKAKEIIQKNIIGPISLIQVCTNRNDPNGAWQYEIEKEANSTTVDWEQFLGPAPKVPWSPERFFRWRCWWDYGTGLSGDLLTHEYDAINQILALGIPRSATASGGVYFFNDGREVPDTFQVALEYPDRKLTFLYSATLSSDFQRGKVIMGHDAAMELSDQLIVTADPKSTRFKEKIEKGIIDVSQPLYIYTPGKEKHDVIASPTERYFASRGLLYTYRGGKRYDTTHLHIKEWIDCIRNGTQPSCDIDQGFEEAITAHMATIAYRENRKVFWDKDKQEIVDYKLNFDQVKADENVAVG